MTSNASAHVRRVAAVPSVVLAALLAWTSGCSDSSGPRLTLADSIPGLLVSAPVRAPGGVAGSVTASASRSLVSDSVVYVSLPLGSVPAGLRATIRDQATGLSVTAAVVDGGFDPVALAGSVGDTLVVEIARSGSSGPIHGRELVKANRPPVVVRTDPPPQKVDVPLNSIMVVVFSEPIDSATLNTGSLQLWRATTRVAGTVRFSDGTGIRAEFHPDSLLAGQTEYRLVVTQTIRDVNGGALASSVTVPFTTGATGPAAGLVFAAVSAGNNHTCGLTTGGAAYCWGDNWIGQLGNGTTANSSTPAPVAGGLTFASLSAGYQYTCGVTTVGAAYCWGDGTEGKIGDGKNAAQTRPVPVAGGLTFAAVSAGGEHTCGVTPEGAAYCWGFGFHGGLGVDTTTFSSCPFHPSSFQFCTTPLAVAGGLSFATVSASDAFPLEHTCAVTTAGAAYCWGVNLAGELGTGAWNGPQQCLRYEGVVDGVSADTIPCARTPVAVSGGRTFGQATTIGLTSCGVTPGGTAYCWGANGGLLGNGTTLGPEGCYNGLDCSTTPVAVAGGLTLTTLSGRGNHVCSLTPAGAAYCWGVNSTGSLGNGTATNSAVPAAVAGGLSFATVSAGSEGHTCGVTTGGVAYCWGENNLGQLGTGTTTGNTVPVKVAGQP